MTAVVQNSSVHHFVSRPIQDNMFMKEPLQIGGDGLLVGKPKLLRWRRPSSPKSFVINCDGSYRASIGTVGHGFIIRDCFGRVILGRAVHFQKIDYINDEVEYKNVVVLAEMLAILDGLLHAKKLGLMNVEIQSDSQIAISVINGWVKCPPHLFLTYSAIHSEISSFEGITFSFVYRECNRAADFLSKFLKDDGKLYFNLSGLPDKLRRIINEDALGFITIRF